MNKFAILINGMSLPYQVLDKVLENAKASKKSIKAVFIYENKDDEDYSEPTNVDVTNADISDSNARKNMEHLVNQNADYVETFFSKKDITSEIVVLKNPTVEDIVAAMKDVEKIYIDHNTYDHPDEFAYVNFSFEELDKELSHKIDKKAQ